MRVAEAHGDGRKAREGGVDRIVGQDLECFYFILFIFLFIFYVEFMSFASENAVSDS